MDPLLLLRFAKRDRAGNLATILAKQKKLDKAIEFYQKSLNIKPMQDKTPASFGRCWTGATPGRPWRCGGRGSD